MGRLRKLKPLVGVVDTRVAKPPPKVVDDYYRSREWLDLRRQALIRDGFRCTAPGCRARAVVVDHIVSRRAGGADDMDNLRSLCRTHDNRVKEDASGVRRSGGSFEA